MFGYIGANKAELKMCEYDTYKAIYCSLCRTLGKEYGLSSRFILSYDFTFLALVLLGIGEKSCEYQAKRCAFHPLKKCDCLKGEYEVLSYCAAGALTMVKYKIKDNLQDEGFFSKIKGYVEYALLRGAFKKAKKRYPDIENKVSEMMKAQKAVEDEKCQSFDKAADPTANLLSFIFSYNQSDESTKRILERIGYCVGKWIYLCDALDDYNDDLKSGNYNPIISKGCACEDVKPLLYMCSQEIASCFELLNFNRYKSILENIIYLGMNEKVKSLTNKEEDSK